MNLYIWDRLDRMTSNYHEEAGVVIIAATLERARLIGAEEAQRYRRDYRTGEPGITDGDPTPDFTCPCDATDERVFIFPDAGCC